MKNYLVIGGSGGIGLSIVKLLQQRGESVIATYNENNPGDLDPGIVFHHYDVLDPSAKIDFLPDELHGLAYCPGSINLKPFSRISPEEFIKDYQLQVIGAVKVIQSSIPALKAGHGSVVLFSTVAVQVGLPFHSLVSASKGAIEGLVRSLSAELAPTIRVNCIAPSLIDTPLSATLLNTEQKREANAQRHPLKRIGTADDIANMAGFLLSENSGWVTGQVFHVDGGMSAIK
ncbi:MAG: SDR family oxidoreductase [Pedobacter sp.]|nr:MAG: SDR family oxidoreductase [Pedobacter sp.]